MTQAEKARLAQVITDRFGNAPDISDIDTGYDHLHRSLSRGSCRAFDGRAVPIDLLNLLSAAALSAPTKSDLQQRDIIIVQSDAVRRDLARLMPGQDWIVQAPTLVVFCGNNRRQRLIHDWHQVAFANDHLDAFFNASVDAGIALGAFVAAAEAVGLGCCPISAIRNQPRAVAELLGLPDHVFAVAGLAVGYPDGTAQPAMRLPLKVTVHVDRYDEGDLQQQVKSYDVTRRITQPNSSQRFTDTFGISDSYSWSEDKVRQYSRPERADFGRYVRDIGFKLD